MNYSIRSQSGEPAYLQLYRQLRDDIISGYYSEGDRLPSKRLLAEETGTSVVTTEHALALLEEEGYIEARSRSGFFCIYKEDRLFAVPGSAAPSAGQGTDSAGQSTDFAGQGAGSAASFTEADEYDRSFSAVPSGSAVSAAETPFPFTVFARTIRKVLTKYDEDILTRSPFNGRVELREALVSYLGRSRGIHVRPEQILIGSGAEYLYGMAVQMIGRERLYALEDPSYGTIRKIYGANGVETEFLSMGRRGIKSEALHASRATVLHVTPFHSFPTGVTASASKRREYIRWAQARDGFILEDDYDSEFTLSSKAEDTLFSLEPERTVFYLNTFSRTLSSSIRIGYMLLPSALCEEMSEKIRFYSCSVPVFDQLVLAEFISSGDFERHINRVRRARRRDLL